MLTYVYVWCPSHQECVANFHYWEESVNSTFTHSSPSKGVSVRMRAHVCLCVCVPPSRLKVPRGSGQLEACKALSIISPNGQRCLARQNNAGRPTACTFQLSVLPSNQSPLRHQESTLATWPYSCAKLFSMLCYYGSEMTTLSFCHLSHGKREDRRTWKGWRENGRCLEDKIMTNLCDEDLIETLTVPQNTVCLLALNADNL